ncbi:uncharacterized protein K02A2.6-like [Gigantopelta aegis]|uniref:uncharacterized protein K02A2.6-like n=1 Tax=Gigantopelta aegis TaxID=1735272 RepID=UPI001B88DFDA|nr:uncharacterized protein K02A2.6-like [Gigantopelta aegis]
MWNNSSFQALGRCKVKTNPVTKRKYMVNFVIVEENLTPLLSRRAAEKMGLITINYHNFEQVSTVLPTNVFVQEFPEVFSGKLGNLPGKKVHLTVNPDADPVIRPARTIPESLKADLKTKLDELVCTEVITPVDKPTDWVSQMSIAKRKSGDIRICIDPRPLNEALKREHYMLPVLDDILPEISQATKFSTCDLKNGYLHCELDEESSLLTTFATPFGRYRWRRLPFGLNVSSEIFQKRLHQALEGLEGVRCVIDDIIVWGHTDDEHDSRVRTLLEHCRNIGISLNAEKCHFGADEISFMGHIVSNRGLKPDPAKIEALVKMEPPTDKEGVERLRGMVNYLSKFLPNLSDVMQPISMLSHQDVEWSWTSIQDKAFSKLKTLLTEAPVLAYFDDKKHLVIQCDASSKGLGAVLLQDSKPLAYASRALTDAETRYATIEKEMLAIIFALEKWHQFTYGRPITVFTDHKPLESISKKPIDRAPKRLQGMLLRALAYGIEVKYLEGKQMYIADTLSRTHLPEKVGQEEFETVNAVTYLTMPEERIDEIRKKTNEDSTLQLLSNTIQNGWPDNKSTLSPLITPFFSVRDELGVTDGLIFRGERLVIPKIMRSEIKKDIHVGHYGIEGCLRRAREYVYWPGMSQEIKEWIGTCETCHDFEQSQPNETLMSYDIPERAWEKIGTDLLSYHGKDYLITVCYKSNFWEIDRLYDTKAKTVITKLKAHFARYGIPDYIVSDNGPQFSSDEFHKFMKKWGITHTPTSPYNSKANGKVESAVKSAKRMLRKTSKSHEDQYLALLNIRNTPTQGVDSSPAQRLLGRRTKTILPTSRNLLKPGNIQNERETEQLRSNQKRQANYYNKSAHDLPVLKKGDTVRMKPFRTGEKFWKKAEVTRRLDERSYELRSGETFYRRNRVHLKKTHEPALDNVLTNFPFETVEPNYRVEKPCHHESTREIPARETLSMSGPSTSRFGRTIKQPTRWKDYVK